MLTLSDLNASYYLKTLVSLYDGLTKHLIVNSIIGDHHKATYSVQTEHIPS